VLCRREERNESPVDNTLDVKTWGTLTVSGELLGALLPLGLSHGVHFREANTLRLRTPN
jgi:hypothetical protein